MPSAASVVPALAVALLCVRDAVGVPAPRTAVSAVPGRDLQQQQLPPWESPTLTQVDGWQSAIGVRGGGSGDGFVDAAYDWCINLGAPAALVAGAVVATLYENVRGGELEVKKSDSNYVRVAKKVTTILLVTAFGLQIVSIFVTTVTGTMLLSRSAFETRATSALDYLRQNFEFEYLTSRLSFLQGLLNWLAAVAVEHTIPRKGEGMAALKMNQFLASSLATLILFLLAFYNAHMTFYENYFEMIRRWFYVASHRFVLQWPPRPLAFAFVPSMVLSLSLFVQALRNEVKDEDYTE